MLYHLIASFIPSYNYGNLIQCSPRFHLNLSVAPAHSHLSRNQKFYHYGCSSDHLSVIRYCKQTIKPNAEELSHLVLGIIHSGDIRYLKYILKNTKVIIPLNLRGKLILEICFSKNLQILQLFESCLDIQMTHQALLLSGLNNNFSMISWLLDRVIANTISPIIITSTAAQYLQAIKNNLKYSLYYLLSGAFYNTTDDIDNPLINNMIIYVLSIHQKFNIAIDWPCTYQSACYSGSISRMSWTALHLSSAELKYSRHIGLIYASKAGHIDIIKHLLQVETYAMWALNNALKEACIHGHMDSVRLLYIYGATNLQNALKLTRLAAVNDNSNYQEIIKYLQALC